MPCSHLPPADAVAFDPAWLTETVLSLARGIAADVALDRLPILADALEDAGCGHFHLLDHLRSNEPHRIECWALRRGLRTRLTLPGGVEMAFAYCPPGTFLMGSPETEAEGAFEEVQQEVRLTRGFYCGVYPVTQAEWRAVMGTDPSHFKGDSLPVESVNWDDAQAFCARVRELTGRSVRLPTEAEWEYACRGGTTTPFYWGAELNGTQANCNGGEPYGTEAPGPYLDATSPVGSYAESFPHPWGLADLHGNVSEWCADWFDWRFFAHIPATDPECKKSEQQSRVLRGGSWADFAVLCRAAPRGRSDPAHRYSDFGFRVVFGLN